MITTIKGWFAPLAPHSNEPGAREMWPSRAAFILASIGSSVGLGNIWRFPALAYKWGGGAFFVPYLLALFIIGIPLMALELSLGKLYRSGDIVCFSRVNKRLRGLGLASIFGSFVVTTYYNVLMGWILVYFFRSFQTVLPWTVKDPMLYFNQDVLMLPADGRTEQPVYIVGHNFGVLLLIWVIIYLCLWKGVQLTGKITYVTMTLPVVLIIVLFFRGITLPGASSGIQDYIGRFDASKLTNPLIWSEAVGQIFFSIGVAFGVFTAYASYNSAHQNTTVDAFIISISNSVYEIFCGFVVFAVVGYLRQQNTNMDVAVGSFGLAFATYPVAFSTLPLAQFWCVFFFLTLFILGIDSAFSLVESGVTCLVDARLFQSCKREWIVAGVCACGFLIGVLFCTEVGMYALDATDYFLNNIGILCVGLMECIGPGFMYKFWNVSQVVGAKSLVAFDACYLLGMVVGVVLGYTVGPVTGVCVFMGITLVGVGSSLALVKQECTLSFRDRLWWITLGNIELLRQDINRSETKGKTRLPVVWSFTLKYLCIPILFLMLTIPFVEMARGSLGVPMPFRWLGITVATITVAFILVGFVMPRWFVWALPSEEQVSTTGENQEPGCGDVHQAGEVGEVEASLESVEMSQRTLAVASV